MGTPLLSSECSALDVAVIHGCSCSLDRTLSLPAGHCLSDAQLRHFHESEWIVITDGSVPVGLAAYKRADGEVRVVHELMLDRTLAGPDAARVTDLLLSALEWVAYDEGIRCLNSSFVTMS